MQNSVVLVDSREAALKESGDVILSKVGHASFGFGFLYSAADKGFVLLFSDDSVRSRANIVVFHERSWHEFVFCLALYMYTAVAVC